MTNLCGRENKLNKKQITKYRTRGVIALERTVANAFSINALERTLAIAFFINDSKQVLECTYNTLVPQGSKEHRTYIYKKK